jgi:ferredoxin
MRKFEYLKDVVTLELSSCKCNGCGMCLKVCPHEVFAMTDKKVYIANKNYCMECGACAKNCAQSAISVKVGVGCAAAIISGAVSGTEPSCGCGCS